MEQNSILQELTVLGLHPQLPIIAVSVLGAVVSGRDAHFLEFGNAVHIQVKRFLGLHRSAA